MSSVPLQVQFDPASARFGASRSQKRLEDDRLLTGKGRYQRRPRLSAAVLDGAGAFAARACQDSTRSTLRSEEEHRACWRRGRWPTCAPTVSATFRFRRSSSAPTARRWQRRRARRSPKARCTTSASRWWRSSPRRAGRRRTRRSCATSNTRICPAWWIRRSGRRAGRAARVAGGGWQRRRRGRVRRCRQRWQRRLRKRGARYRARAAQPARHRDGDGAARVHRRVRGRPHHALHAEPDARAARAICSARCSRRSREDFRIVVGDIGGGFGMKTGLTPEDALVCYAARKLGRPVRWRAERSEEFLAAHMGRDQHNEAAPGARPRRAHPRPAGGYAGQHRRGAGRLVGDHPAAARAEGADDRLSRAAGALPRPCGADAHHGDRRVPRRRTARGRTT